MLPSFVTLEAFAVRIPGGISAADEERAEAALVDASALVRAAARKTWVTGGALDADLPDVIVTVTAAAARRAMVNPDGVRSEGIGSYSVGFADASSDVYLTKKETALVRQVAGASGLWTQATTRGDADVPSVHPALVGDLAEETDPFGI